MVGAERKFTIGRDLRCDVVLADDSVSRRHAELLVFPDGMLFFTDCASSLGSTLIRDGAERPLRQEVLMPDDRLRLGELELSAADLLSLARDSGARGSDLPGAAARPPSDSEGERWARGTVLVRCDCGHIKPKDAPCPHCKQ